KVPEPPRADPLLIRICNYSIFINKSLESRSKLSVYATSYKSIIIETKTDIGILQSYNIDALLLKVCCLLAISLLFSPDIFDLSESTHVYAVPSLSE
ncbi:unnamed protein product, partial [Cylicocyclus nassatus]